MVDIFDEVSEDLRAEQAARLLKRYAGLLVGAAALVLAGVGAQQGWQYYQKRQNNHAASSFIALTNMVDTQGSGITNDQRVADAKALVNFAATAQPGYNALAILRAAALYQDAGQADAADALWNQIGANKSADPLLRDVANLLWAQHVLGTAPDDAVAARLQPLSAPENPYHALAQETQALLYLHEGKIDQAKALYSQISSDPNAPEAVRNRADGLLAKLNG